ncbi:MAG: hypothetical protein ABJF50_21110 [Paracoccaceae bacterium]
MFVEHTYTHKKPPDPGLHNGEFLMLKMWIGTDENTQGDSFECRSYDNRLPKKLINRIREGVSSALQNHKFPSLKVVVIEYRWMEPNSPEWLFEVAAKACVQEALQKLAV